MKQTLFSLVLTLLLTLSAQSTPATCPDYTNRIFKFENLVELIRNPNCHIKSIDDAIAKLPENMRSRLALFYRSQSMQGPHRDGYLYPRAILSSKIFDKSNTAYSISRGLSPLLMLSFNGHPAQPGYDRLETVDINPDLDPDNIFKYFEITFPKDDESKAMTWEQAQSRILVSKANPATCIQCHGNPARPIFQQYPDWQGAYGARHNARLSDDDVQGLNQFIQKHSNDPNSRYRHLNPDRFAAGGSRYASQENATLKDVLSFSMAMQTIKIYDDLSYANSIRVSKIIMNQAFYPQFRYAIAAANYCESYNNIIPQPVLEALKKNLISRYGMETNIDAAIKKYSAAFDGFDPGEFGGLSRIVPYQPRPVLPNEPYKEDKGTIQQHAAYWNQDPVLFALWMDTMLRQGASRAMPDAAFLRFIFTGLNVDISPWFTDLKMGTYRTNTGVTAGILGLLKDLDPELEKMFKSIVGNSPVVTPQVYKTYCKDLTVKSMEALKNFDMSKYVTEAPPLQRPDAAYPPIFKNTCAKCHTENAVGPAIPFQDQASFEIWLRAGNNAKRIKYRTLQAPEQLQMPPIRALTEQERRELQNYLNKF